MVSRTFVRMVMLLVTFAAGGARDVVAKEFDDIFLFGDSYTDSGALAALTNGSTAGAYLARFYGISLVTSKEPSPGRSGVNFAESGARIVADPVGAHPSSLTRQVAAFEGYVQSGSVTFDPEHTLFFLLGGLNEHASPSGPLADATLDQIATLHRLGARTFEVASLPTLIPPFADSAANLNPVFADLLPRLRALYPDSVFKLSGWGAYYDDIIADPATYGITNTTDPCVDPHHACRIPDEYFYYYAAHPSDRAHEIVGERLYAEARAMPEPWPLGLVGVGTVGLLVARRRR